MFEELKPLMEHGERYIIVEDGKPQYVCMCFADYVLFRAGVGVGAPGVRKPRRDDLVSVNAELDEVRVPSPEPAEAPSFDPASVRLEDLPL